MDDRLQDALVIRGTKRHSRVPAHFLQHGAATVISSDLRRRGTHDVSVHVRGSACLAAGSTRASTTGWPCATLVRVSGDFSAGEEGFELVDLVWVESGRAAGFGEDGEAVVSLAAGDGFEGERVGHFVDDLAVFLGHGRELEAGIYLASIKAEK